MTELDRFTPKQKKDLQDLGYHGLYSILTHFPYSLTNINPWGSHIQEGEFESYFLFEDILKSCHKRSSQRPYWHIQWQSGLTMYYFNTAPFTRGILKPGERFQALVKKQNQFLTIFRLQKRQQQTLTDRFVLGKGNINTSYIIPKYPKVKAIDSARWLTIHNRIQRPEYVLDLTGMIPDELDLPELFDTWNIHHPSSIKAYQKASAQWKTFQVFLYMVTYYSWSQKNKQYGARIEYDPQWLEDATSHLPYSLSPSQQSAISQILTALT